LILSELDHDRYMRRAIALAANAPAFPFGSVIVERDRGAILAEGWNRGSINPTWHGEIDAINQLVRANPKFDGSKLALYTTAEPCPMCQAAILWSGIEMVIFGASIRFLQQHGWRQIDISAAEVVRRSPGWRCTLMGGVLEEACNALFLTAARSTID
jgi:tRNA(Arg) A34 adenosine deaminase TadA